MDAVNLRGSDMGKGRRRRSSRDLRPDTTTTSARMTNVRDPRAEARFTSGGLVSWCEELAIYIAADPNDPTLAIVQLQNGELAKWPACLPGMRREQTPDYDTPTEERLACAVAAAEDDYAEFAIESAPDEQQTVADLFDVGPTLPDGQRGR